MPDIAPLAVDDPVAARLLDRYFAFRTAGFTTHAGGYHVSHPDPAAFVPPDGVFVVIRNDGAAVGCGGVRRIDLGDGVVTFEVKHLWLEESARGHGWSRLMLGDLEDRAIGWGATRLVLDTNASLDAAQHLYRTSGYREIAPYNENPNATHWFAKVVTGA